VPAVLLLLLAAAPFAKAGGEVSATGQIRIDGQHQTVRQINGRWFSPDNRELRQTSSQWLWTISGGNARHLVRFHHHNPVDPARVSSLDRSMSPAQVRSVLGEPNAVFPSDKPESQQHWQYYGAGGYKLSLLFSSDGGIFTASVEPDAQSRPQDVPHLTFRYQGRSARESFAERKAQSPQSRVSAQTRESTAERRARLRAEMEARRTGRAPASSTLTVVDPAPTAPPLPPGRKVSPEELAQVTVGMEKAKLLELLGHPASRMSIAGSDGAQEFFTYEKLDGAKVTIVLHAGKVFRLP
jgi:hypothetical protein